MGNKIKKFFQKIFDPKFFDQVLQLTLWKRIVLSITAILIIFSITYGILLLVSPGIEKSANTKNNGSSDGASIETNDDNNKDLVQGGDAGANLEEGSGNASDDNDSGGIEMSRTGPTNQQRNYTLGSYSINLLDSFKFLQKEAKPAAEIATVVTKNPDSCYRITIIKQVLKGENLEQHVANELNADSYEQVADKSMEKKFKIDNLETISVGSMAIGNKYNIFARRGDEVFYHRVNYLVPEGASHSVYQQCEVNYNDALLLEQLRQIVIS